MVVCKFWLDNRCKYGSACRFEHTKDGSGNLFSTNSNWHNLGGGNGSGQRVTFQNGFGSNGSNQFKWVANQAQGPHEQSNQRSPSEIVNSLQDEMNTLEKSNMWPFTCITIDKDLPCLPDFEDTSAEEMRFDAYKSKAEGTMQSHIQKYQALAAEFRTKRQQLQHMPMDLKQKLIKFVEDERKKKTQQSPISSGIGLSNQTQTNLFGSSGMSSSSTLFGKSQSSVSPFGGMTSSSTSSTPGLFGSGFGGPSSTQRSLFGGNSGDATSPGSAFGGSKFGPSSQGSINGGSGSLFGKPTGSVFGGGNQSNHQASLLGPGPSMSSGLFGSQSAASQTSQGLFSSGANNSQSPLTGLSSSGGSLSAQGPPNLFGGGLNSTGSTGLFGKPSGPVASQPSLLSPVPTNLQAPSFGSSGGSQSVLVTSTTANQQTQQAAPNLFGKSSNVFGNISSQVLAGGNSGGSGLFGKGSPAQSNSSGPVQAGEAAAVEVSSIYTPLSDLTEAEKAAFKAKAFQLGKIPIRPPSKELIHG